MCGSRMLELTRCTLTCGECIVLNARQGGGNVEGTHTGSLLSESSTLSVVVSQQPLVGCDGRERNSVLCLFQVEPPTATVSLRSRIRGNSGDADLPEGPESRLLAQREEDEEAEFPGLC